MAVKWKEPEETAVMRPRRSKASRAFAASRECLEALPHKTSWCRCANLSCVTDFKHAS